MKKIYTICFITVVSIATSFAQNSSVKFSKSATGSAATEASVTTVGIGEVGQVSNVKIYSYANSVFVNTTLSYLKSRVEIFNLLGEKIIDESMTGSSYKLDINTNANSYYIVRVSLDEKSYSKRVYIR